MDIACSGTRAVSCGVVSVQALAFVSAERFENRFKLAPRDLTDRVARCADEVAAMVAFRCVLISVTTAPGVRSLRSDLRPLACASRRRRTIAVSRYRLCANLINPITSEVRARFVQRSSRPLRNKSMCANTCSTRARVLA